jgi:hypothetical protein
MATFPRPTVLAVLLTLLVGTSGCTPAATLPSGDPSRTPTPAPGVLTTPSDPAYEVSLAADEAGHVWTGTERIGFRNSAADPLDRVWLRLWANGPEGCDPLAVDVTVTDGGTAGEPQRACTALEIVLPAPLAPGERASIALSLTITVPPRNDRFGYHGNVANLGGALPILAILDDGGWHLDPYVDIGESFYSVPGRYRVTLEVSTSMATPATGTLVQREEVGDRERRTFVAEDVRDFMWSAGRLAARSATVDGILVRVWSSPDEVTAARATSALATTRRSLRTYDRLFGAYPYQELDVVLGRFVTFGGMEYPQLVLAKPSAIPIAHEVAHQWWWVVVGSDQYAEPWLDESLATWSAQVALGGSRPCERWRWPSASARLGRDMGYWARHPTSYPTIYDGGACMLSDLSAQLGPGVLERTLADYAASFRFGIARVEDFWALVEAAAVQAAPGIDVAAFRDGWRVS